MKTRKDAILVIAILGLFLIAGQIGTYVLLAYGVPVSDRFDNLQSMALGALASMLASTRTGDEQNSRSESAPPEERP